MARSGFTEKFLKAVFHAQENPEIFVMMIEIEHSDLIIPLRYCNQKRKVTSNGEDYFARTMSFSLPNEYGDQAPNMSLSIVDTDYEVSLATFACATDSPFTITMRLALKSSLDDIEFLAKWDTTEDAHEVEGLSVFSGTLDHGLNQIYPMHAYTPWSNPGLFSKAALE